MERSLVVIGVPWSAHELAPAVRDAKTLGARIRLVDTPENLALVDPELDIDTIAVGALACPQIVEQLDRCSVDCVLSLTEMTLGVAAQVREALGHSGTSAQAERNVSDKAWTRRTLSAAGLTRVGFWEVSLDDLPSLVRTLELPLVAKPRSLTGSTGVQLIRTPADVACLQAQYDRSAAASYGRDRLLVETFIPGEEISAEAMVVDGELTLLAVTDKFNSGPPHFFELGHIMPSCHTAGWAVKIADYLQRVVRALNIVTSPIHAELKLCDGEVELVEIHSRFGGDNIVRLLEETFAVRAFECYFAAMVSGRAPPVASANHICGVAFFTGRLGQSYLPMSFDFPCPERIAEIDFDIRREPKLETYEGVKLLFRRLGHCFFASNDYDEVARSVAFVAEHLCMVEAERVEDRRT